MGLIVAAAYVAGTADAREQHVRLASMAKTVDGAYSEVALRDRLLNMDPATLAVAKRHDPLTTAADVQRDRQAMLLAARLDKRAGTGNNAAAAGLLLRASFGGPFNPAAEPFQLASPLNASRDLECLTQAVYYEARGETPAGQAAVAQVVLNRVRHPAFPKSVCGVVFQGAYSRGACQFSFACDGSMRRGRESGAWSRARKIAERALNGTVMAGVGNATHFHTTNVSPGWGARMVRVQQVGTHIFYRFGGRGGQPGAFGERPELSSGDFEVVQATSLPTGPVPYEIVTGSGARVILASAVSEADAPNVTDKPAPAAKAAPAKAKDAAPVAARPASAPPTAGPAPKPVAAS
jgi:spore germination cell wall hydrolase CwlJ-like protein